MITTKDLASLGPVECPNCKGSGKAPTEIIKDDVDCLIFVVGGIFTCSTCKGTGKIGCTVIVLP